jgi:hypothetical protein
VKNLCPPANARQSKVFSDIFFGLGAKLPTRKYRFASQKKQALETQNESWLAWNLYIIEQTFIHLVGKNGHTKMTSLS